MDRLNEMHSQEHVNIYLGNIYNVLTRHVHFKDYSDKTTFMRYYMSSLNYSIHEMGEEDFISFFHLMSRVIRTSKFVLTTWVEDALQYVDNRSNFFEVMKEFYNELVFYVQTAKYFNPQIYVE